MNKGRLSHSKLRRKTFGRSEYWFYRWDYIMTLNIRCSRWFYFNTHMASWKLIAFCPATALSWGLHLMLIISSSGRRSPLRTGYLTRRQSQVSPCSSHSRTPHSSNLSRSTRNTLSRVVAEIWHPVDCWGAGTSSNTGGALWPGGRRRIDENRAWVSVFKQWISEIKEIHQNIVLLLLLFTNIQSMRNEKIFPIKCCII